MKRCKLLSLFLSVVPLLFAQDRISLANNQLECTWEKNGDWRAVEVRVQNKAGVGSTVDKGGLFNQVVIYSEDSPDMAPIDTFKTVQNTHFPEKVFRYPYQAWKSNISEVSLNTSGVRENVVPSRLITETPLTFQSESALGVITTSWTVEKNSLLVHQVFKAKKRGYYSVSTPELVVVPENEIDWVTIPGYLHAKEVSDDFTTAYGYGYYISRKPVIYQDRCATTPSVILSSNGMTVGLTPEASYPRKPHDAVGNTHLDWNVGLSIMNVQGNISPTLYYPVLGQSNSFLEEGETVAFDYRYVFSTSDWYSVYKQIVYDVYDFKKTRMMHNRKPLIERIYKMHHSLTDTNTSKFRLVDCEGTTIGAHDYMGGVAGADKDAMKNSDYGAMWMLGTLTQDPALLEGILPYARNFKIKQQYLEKDDTYRGAVKGQYYLWKSSKWAEEWGEHIEPVAVAYYGVIDLANILLFNPKDKEVKNNLKLAADYLLKTQRQDGSWDVGIDKYSGEVIYPDLEDLRPTFYGLWAAYKILKQKKYLDAAVRGADWFVDNAVEKGQFLGVCGDTRFSPDFATAQSAQALLEMFAETGDDRYKQAAVKTAKFYTTYIYTYPNGSTDIQKQGNQELPGWGFTQSGLHFEHGGTIGSSNTRGPILLASHAGMFLRLFSLTQDSLFLDMGRAVANGRDAFVDPKTGMASYYWDGFNRGAGGFPHHGWWQIGWIMDYLVSEAELRSEGDISFPRGFVTPKVGPHQTIGFAPGKINGERVHLVLSESLVKSDNPLCEYLIAKSKKNLYVIAMNSADRSIEVNLNIKDKLKRRVSLAPYGISIVKMQEE